MKIENVLEKFGFSRHEAQVYLSALETGLASAQDIAEQAELIQQIGEDAARDFDVEAHARSLRAQIESLLTKPATAKPTAPTGAVENTTPQPESADKPSAVVVPATATANGNASTTGADPATLREAILVLRRAANELETRIESSAKKQ